MWADVAEIPGKGKARRAVLVGESSARGFLLDPAMTPSKALASHLEQWAGPGAYQCVDLAQTGASLEDVTELLARVPHIDPDVLVLYVGNNWSVPQYSVADLDALSRELRSGGYASMRRAFWPLIVLPRAELLLARIEEILRRKVDVVVVIPEFNLREWVPPANVEVPALPPEAFIEWYELRQKAETALGDGDWNAVPPLAERMRVLDEGCSPVTGHLLGRALEALGDGIGARQAWEDSRDSVCGLLIRYTPRVTRAVQEFLLGFCRRNDLGYVDLRRLLAADDLSEAPDPRHFLDFCHLSESGIDIAMSAVAEAIQQPGEAKSGIGQRPRRTSARNDLNSRDRAASHLMAACYNAYNRQPAPVLRRHLRCALEIWPDSLELAEALLDVLEGAGPLWTHRQFSRLTALPHFARSLEMLAARRSESLGLWTLRACLAEIMPDREPPPSPAGECSIELLEVPEGPPGLGHTAPNFTAGGSRIQATSRYTDLYFLQTPGYSDIELTYRMATMESMDPAHVKLNGIPIGILPFAREWSSVRLPIHVKSPGICKLEILWPVGCVDYAQRRSADTIALSKGDYPYVLPVFGEICSARVFRSYCAPNTAAIGSDDSDNGRIP